MQWRKKANMGLLEQRSVGDFCIRIYKNRLAIWKKTGERLTWEELQNVKQIIWGNKVAVEIYPSENDVVNIKHTRHLWWTEKLEQTAKDECRHEEFGMPST
jgi:hypothetical protein